MFRFCKYLLGVCTGANMLACVVAHIYLYLFTGKVPMMVGGKARLLSPDEATLRVRTWTEKVTGTRNA
jgi:hypothetical protein